MTLYSETVKCVDGTCDCIYEKKSYTLQEAKETRELFSSRDMSENVDICMSLLHAKDDYAKYIGVQMFQYVLKTESRLKLKFPSQRAHTTVVPLIAAAVHTGIFKDIAAVERMDMVSIETRNDLRKQILGESAPFFYREGIDND